MLDRINWVDIVVLILLIRTSYVGFSRGLTKNFFSFLGIIAANYISIHYYNVLAVLLTDNLDFLTQRSAILISFILILSASIFGFKIVIFLTSHLIKLEFAAFLERVGGMIIGIVYGFIFCSLLLVILSFSGTEYINNSLRSSFSASTMVKVAPMTYDAVLKILPVEPSAGRSKIKSGFIKE